VQFLHWTANSAVSWPSILKLSLLWTYVWWIRSGRSFFSLFSSRSSGLSERFFLFLLHFSNQPAPHPLSWSLQERVMEQWQEGWGVGKVNLSALDTHTHTHTHTHTPILWTADRVPASFWWLRGMRPIGKSNPCRSCTILHPYAG